jgi:hypothetical protein
LCTYCTKRNTQSHTQTQRILVHKSDKSKTKKKKREQTNTSRHKERRWAHRSPRLRHLLVFEEPVTLTLTLI